MQHAMTPWLQRFKWTVYALLFINFLVYLYQDIEAARYTLTERSGLRDYLAAYVTSIDLIAWFTLILFYELETYALVGRGWTGRTKWTVRGVRLVCVMAILNTSFTYDIALRAFENPTRLPVATDVCAYTGDWYFLRNREFLEIDAGNCPSIGTGPEFFAIGDGTVLTDRAGLREGLVLAWTDLIESVTWLLIVLAMEASVRLRSTSFANGPLPVAIGRIKAFLYAVILLIAFYWGSKGQILYLWDEIVWVLGFLVIDGNLRDWRSLRRVFSASPSAA